MNRYRHLLLLLAVSVVAGCSSNTTLTPSTTGTGNIVYNKIAQSDVPDNMLSLLTALRATQGSIPQKIQAADVDGAYIGDWGVGFVTSAENGKVAYLTLDTAGTAYTVKIIVANNDNSSPHTIYSFIYPTEKNLALLPMLSVDGAKVAFATYDSSSIKATLYVANTDGTVLTQISDNFNGLTIPCFSDDHSMIDYYEIVDPAGGSAFASTNTGGLNQKTIHYNSYVHPGPFDEGQVSLQHGTSTIAYADAEQVFTLNLSGTPAVRVDSGFAPSWSPDGSKLLYESTSHHLIVTPDKGSTKIDLTTGNAAEVLCAWSSDGASILCNSWPNGFGNGNASLVRIELATKQRKTIAAGTFDGYFLK
ncbi:MAG: PD40 domain-containing protein [Bacteroidetes bacterium]|nr:PD40 domain-containing protein [Bacteroidota bacterium]